MHQVDASGSLIFAGFFMILMHGKGHLEQLNATIVNGLYEASPAPSPHSHLPTMLYPSPPFLHITLC